MVQECIWYLINDSGVYLILTEVPYCKSLGICSHILPIDIRNSFAISDHVASDQGIVVGWPPAQDYRVGQSSCSHLARLSRHPVFCKASWEKMMKNSLSWQTPDAAYALESSAEAMSLRLYTELNWLPETFRWWYRFVYTCYMLQIMLLSMKKDVKRFTAVSISKFFFFLAWSSEL